MINKVLVAGLLMFLALDVVNGLKPVEESYIMYTVKCGDTMWGIADNYYHLTNTGMCFDDYRCKLTNINGDLKVLKPGDVVKVPVWKKVRK